MYSLGTWFVSGICVWIPYIKETIIIIIIIIRRSRMVLVKKKDAWTISIELRQKTGR
jgi:hypothetical protein